MVAFHLFCLDLKLVFDLNVVYTQLLVLLLKLENDFIHALGFFSDFVDFVVFLLAGLEEFGDLLGTRVVQEGGIGLLWVGDLGLAADCCVGGLWAGGLLEIFLYWLELDRVVDALVFLFYYWYRLLSPNSFKVLLIFSSYFKVFLLFSSYFKVFLLSPNSFKVFLLFSNSFKVFSINPGQMGPQNIIFISNIIELGIKG